VTDDRKHFFRCVDTLLKALSASAFFGLFAFTCDVGTVGYWHATDYGDDISLSDEAVIIEVIDLEN
jgi:hypothetical protein